MKANLMKHLPFLLVLLQLSNFALAQSSNICAAESDENGEEPRVGFEILQIVSPNEYITWLSREITQEEFDAIELPLNWFKNQPREGDADSASFNGSPGTQNGELIEEMHFGHLWTHVATVVETGILLDDDGLLRANIIEKSHTLAFNAGRTVPVIISPEGETYVRVSRDAGRCSDIPTIPEDWRLVDITMPVDTVIELPNPTTNIRVDNEDSFQGPTTALESYIESEQTIDSILHSATDTQLIYDNEQRLQLLSACAVIDSNVENSDGSNKDYPDATSLLFDVVEDGSVILLTYKSHTFLDLDENGLLTTTDAVLPCKDRLEIYSSSEAEIVSMLFTSSSVPVGEPETLHSIVARLDSAASSASALILEDAKESSTFTAITCPDFGDFSTQTNEVIDGSSTSSITLRMPSCGETNIMLRINGAAYQNFASGETVTLDLTEFSPGEYSFTVRPYDAHYLLNDAQFGARLYDIE